MSPPPADPTGPLPRAEAKRVWVISACLLGARCRYDGDTARPTARARILPILNEPHVPVCPEELGGLGTPRAAARLYGGDGAAVWEGRASVQTASGVEVTAAFLRGAERASQIARVNGATHACLKARSPSCGVGSVYGPNGLLPGQGVAAARLAADGLVVVSEETLAARFRSAGQPR